MVCIGADRQEWHGVCKGGLSVSSTARDGRFYCDGCQRSFSRSQNKVRHSCGSVRSRHAAGTVSVPVACSHCWRTFRRPQDMARHKWSEPEDYGNLSTQSAVRQRDITFWWSTIQVQVRVCMRVCVRTCMCACMCVCVLCVCLCARACVCLCVLMCMHECVSVMCTCVEVCTPCVHLQVCAHAPM